MESSSAERHEPEGPSWALVPFWARCPIKKPVFFHSPEEVRRCWSTPIFGDIDEKKDLETRDQWLEAIASDVPAPLILSMGEQLVQAFSRAEPPKGASSAQTTARQSDRWTSAKSATEASFRFERHVLQEHDFSTYRLYMSHPAKKHVARIFRKRGCAAGLQYLKWRRVLLNPPMSFVQIPAPVHRLTGDRGPSCTLRLSDYIRLEELNPTPGDADALLDSCFSNLTDPYMYCLHPDWDFRQIQQRAIRSCWHQAPERKLAIENLRKYFGRVVLELDDALRECRPDLSAAAVQAFWTSWEVSEHLKEIERKIQKYASQPGAVADGLPGEAKGAIEEIVRVYVNDCSRERSENPGSRAQARKEQMRETLRGEQSDGLARQAATIRKQKPPRTNDQLRQIKLLVRNLRAEGLSHYEICKRLANSPRPPQARWRHLSWSDAFRKHTNSVRAWLSKALR